MSLCNLPQPEAAGAVNRQKRADDPCFSSGGKCVIVLTKGDLAIDAETYG
jgi:hypothetical protein